MHIIVLPRASEGPTIRPFVYAGAINLVLEPLTVVHTSVGPDVATPSMFHTFFVASLVVAAIRPSFDTHTILEIVVPLTFVFGTVLMYVDTLTVCLVILPVSFINITVSVPEFTLAIGFVVAPFALISRTVGPHLRTRAMSAAVEQVSSVNSPILKTELFNELELFRNSILLQICEEAHLCEMCLLIKLTVLHRCGCMLLVTRYLTISVLVSLLD
jgi:hypothetical protein